MGWGKVVGYILDFLHWIWDNKWTIIFMVLSFILFSMYSCERNKTDELEQQLESEKKSTEKCEVEKELLSNCNTDLENGLDVCQRELQITKQSFKEAELIKEQFDLEISKYKQLASEIDNEKDPEKSLELKKALIEQLFKGKSNSQIMMIKNKLKLKKGERK
jgi:hypothetical protein